MFVFSYLRDLIALCLFGISYLDIEVWFPLAVCGCLAVVTSLAAWKLLSPFIDFARRRVSDITAGQRSGGGGGGGGGSGSGGGGSDQGLFFTPVTRAFIAHVAILSASALPAVCVLLFYARQKFVSRQRVLPS